MKYFDLDTITGVHDFLVSEYGGLKGIRNEDSIRGILGYVQDDGFYPDVESKAAYLMYSIVQNHPFTDCNKRTAVIATAMFVHSNTHASRKDMDMFILWAEQTVLNIATGKINLNDLKSSMSDILYDIMNL